jgi:tetratricopeptide (TPR) repeat protein
MSNHKNISKLNRAGFLLALLLLMSLLSSCILDFTPRIHQKILVAQKYITDQEYLKAVKQYEEILEEIPPREIKIKIYYQLGELYAISLGEHRKGIEYYEKIRELSTEPLWLVKSQERVGEIAFNYLKDYKTSRSVYEELVTFRPRLDNYPMYEFRLAESLLNLKNYSEFQKIINSIQTNVAGPYFVDSFYLMSIFYMELKDWHKSITYMREYIRREKRKDKVVRAKFLLANAYEVIEKLKTAYNIYYSILGEYPNTEVIQERLKSVYERRVARRR